MTYKQRQHFLHPDYKDDGEHKDHPYNDLSDDKLRDMSVNEYEKYEVLGSERGLENHKIAEKLRIRRARREYDRLYGKKKIEEGIAGKSMKIPSLLIKRNVKDQKAWFSKNWPKDTPMPTEFKHLESSATKAKKSMVVDKAVKAAREKISNKAYGATKGTKFGGDDNVAGTAISDLINKAKQAGDVKHIYARADLQVPSTKDDDAEDTKSSKKGSSSGSSSKIDRLALIKKAHKKLQSASRFDIPTLDPNDRDYDDEADVPFTVSKRGSVDEEIGQVLASIRGRMSSNKHVKIPNPNASKKNPNPAKAPVGAVRPAGKLKIRSRPIQKVIGEALDSIVGEEVSKTGHRKFRNDVRKAHGKDVRFWKDQVQNRLVAFRNDPYDRKRIVGTFSHASKNAAIFKENYDHITEVLGPDATASDYIHDFVNSKHENFKGKTKKQRISMALGAYYGSKKKSLSEMSRKPMATKTLSKGRRILNRVGLVAKGAILGAAAAGVLHTSTHNLDTTEKPRTPEQVQSMNSKLEKKLPHTDIEGKRHYILNGKAKEFVPNKTKIVVHQGKIYHVWSSGKYNYAFQHPGKTTKV